MQLNSKSEAPNSKRKQKENLLARYIRQWAEKVEIKA
jgi:hypothetical protein